MRQTFSKYLILLAAAIISLSCSKEGDKAANELISASPAEVSAPAALNSQKVKVEANCVWDLTVTANDGSEVAWIVPDKKSANGNADVTLKIYANKFNARTATLTFRTRGGQTSVVTVNQAGDDNASSEYVELPVRVGSYNIRVSGQSSDTGDLKWENRKENVFKTIKNNDFDIFGIQEVKTDQQKDIQTGLGDIYGIKFFSPYSQDGNGDKAQGLLYKKDVFTLSEWNYFWPSDNPSTMSKNDIDGGISYSRGSCCAVLTHKQSGVKIFFMVMHGFLNDATGDKYAKVNNDMEKQFNKKGYPAFFVGDFNATDSRPAYNTWASYWKDTYKTLTSDKRSGPAGTYNGWSAPKSRIDFILYRGEAAPQSYKCDDVKYNGNYPSDHFPIVAEFIVKSTAE